MAVTTSRASPGVPSATTPALPKIHATAVCAHSSRAEIISTLSSATISCLIVVCTDVLTGEAVYHKMERVDFDELEWLRASASMPLASKVVEVGGRKLLDGGVADSIPLEYFESIGYERNVVILTQPAGFVKEPNKLMPLMKIGLRKYPNMIEAMATRHLMYNRELEYVREAEREGRCLVIRPDEKLPIGHICHDPEKMRRVYEIGRRMGERYIDRIKDFYR